VQSLGRSSGRLGVRNAPQNGIGTDRLHLQQLVVTVLWGHSQDAVTPMTTTTGTLDYGAVCHLHGG